MFLNPALSAALDRIAERAADVRRAYTPGATPQYGDASTTGPASDFTLDPLAVSVADGYYFVTRDAAGDIAFTRNGSFTLRDGRLVDAEGASVCAQSQSGALTGLQADAVDAALGRVGDARIESDGSLVYQRSVVDPRSGRRRLQRVVAGRVALAHFPAGTQLISSNGSRNVAPPGVAPRIGAAGSNGFPALVPMHLTRSRVDIDRSLARLKEAYVAFEALQAAEAAKAHLGKTAMDLVK